MKILQTLFALVLLLATASTVFAATPYERAVALMNTIYAPQAQAPHQLAVSTMASDAACLDLTANHARGMTDSRGGVDSVRKLQNFLYPKYLSEPATGYFGVLTEAAVAKFQRDNGITPAVGFVGELTRTKIKELTCGGSSNALLINSISPTAAKVGETVALSGSGLNTGGDYILFDGYRIETDGSKALNRVAFVVPEYLSHTFNCIKAPCPDAPVLSVIPGEYTVQVVNNLGTSNKVVLTVKEGSIVPSDDEVKISEVKPNAAKVDEKVVIYGYNLNETKTEVLFDGVKIPSDPVYLKRLGNFDSALQFTVPDYLSPSCNRLKPTDPCPLGMARPVVPGNYELAVENKYGRDAVKFQVLSSSITPAKPSLSKLYPTQGAVGTEVLLYGTNIQTGSEKVYFGDSLVSAKLLSTNSRGMIRFVVPEYITPCGYEDNIACRMMAQLVTPGNYDVVVKNSAGVSNKLTFKVTASVGTVAPKIVSLTPSSGVVGTEVVIRGEEINIGSDKIYFKGSLVNPVSSSDELNKLRFKVPSYITPCGVGASGACDIVTQPVIPGTYDVVVVNKNGTSNSRNFTVTGTATSKLEITSFYVKDYTFSSGNSQGAGRKLVWTTTGAESCEASGAWSGTRPINGEYVIGFMSQPLTYTLTCYNNKGVSVSKSVTDPSTGTTPQAPVISRISPTSVSVGTQVSITGERLNTGNAKVIFGNGSITPDPTRSSDSLLVFTVPSLMSRYCAPGLFCTDDMISVTPGDYSVKVINSFGTSNDKRVTVETSVAATPSISGIAPASGGTGVAVVLSGANFNSASDYVWFGGLKVAPNRNMKNLNSLVFTVPQTLFECDADSSKECLAMYQPTPLGSYKVKVENSEGKVSNSVNYQVTSNGSISDR